MASRKFSLEKLLKPRPLGPVGITRIVESILRDCKVALSDDSANNQNDPNRFLTQIYWAFRPYGGSIMSPPDLWLGSPWPPTVNNFIWIELTELIIDNQRYAEPQGGQKELSS